VAQVVKYLCSKHEAIISNPSTTKKKKKRKDTKVQGYLFGKREGSSGVEGESVMGIDMTKVYYIYVTMKLIILYNKKFITDNGR
jgi:hypothetical protein